MEPKHVFGKNSLRAADLCLSVAFIAPAFFDLPLVHKYNGRLEKSSVFFSSLATLLSQDYALWSASSAECPYL